MRGLFLSSLLIFAVLNSARGDDWPQWLGPKRDGVWREAGILEKFPAGGPKVLWRKPIGGGYSGPAVADGKIFVMDRILPEGTSNPANPFGKGKIPGSERVLCLDEKSGNTLWKQEYDCPYSVSYPAGPRCTPTVDGDRVYTLGAMGNLYCLSTADGKIIWSRDFVEDYHAEVPLWGFAAHPLIDGDRLICLVGGNQNRLVIAFDKRTGKEIWTALSCGGDFGYSPPMIYTFAGKRQLVVWDSKHCTGLDPADGNKLWSIDFDVRMALNVPATRQVDEDKLLLSTFYNGSRMVKIEGNSTAADFVWKGKSNSEMPTKTDGLHSIMTTPFVKDGFIYGVCSYGQLRCLEASTGNRVWETMQATRGRKTDKKTRDSEEPTGKERWSHAFLIEHEKRFFIFNEQGELIIAELSPGGYKEIDRTVILEPTNPMPGRLVVWTHPAFANRNMYVRNDKEIVAVSLEK